MIQKGDKVRVVNLDDWLPFEDPSKWLGKEGTVTDVGVVYIEVDILSDREYSLWLEEELEKI